MSSMQIFHSWQSIITSPPHEKLDFIRNPELPQALPKFPLIVQIGTTYSRSRSTWNNQFESATSREHTWRTVSPSNTITWMPKTQRNSQKYISFVREKKILNHWFLPRKSVLVDKETNSCIISQLRQGRNNRASSLVWQPTISFSPHRFPIPYTPNHPLSNNIPCTKKAFPCIGPYNRLQIGRASWRERV